MIELPQKPTSDRSGVVAQPVEQLPGFDDQVWFRLNMEVPTQKMARLILIGLPEDFDPEVYGFERQ